MSSTNRGAKRRPNDDYQTPPPTIGSLLEHVTPFGKFLEPCKGSGNILQAVAPYVGHADWCEITEGRDFLSFVNDGLPYDWIISNPPFSLAREFIDRSIQLATNMAMLLRLNFLESNDRLPWWQDKTPDAIYALSHRPNFLDREGRPILNKHGKPGTDSCGYGWFVWSASYTGIHVIGPPEET